MQGPTYDVGIGNLLLALDGSATGPTSRNIASLPPVKHDPFISFDGAVATVGVRGTNGSTTSLHPQLNAAHWIQAIWVKDQTGAVVFFKDMNNSATASVSFAVPAGSTSLTPYELCNLHGLWQAMLASVFC